MRGRFSRFAGIASWALHLIAQMKLAFGAANLKHLYFYPEAQRMNESCQLSDTCGTFIGEDLSSLMHISGVALMPLF